MIDRTKSLTDQTASDLRVLLDALHGNREHYDRTNRIVEARSCELEIAEVTRALAVINCRATRAEDQRAREGTRMLTDQQVSEAIKSAFAEVDGDILDEVDDATVAAIADHAAKELVGAGVDPGQREADLREAYCEGAKYIADNGIISMEDVPREATEYARSKAGG